MNRLFKNFSYAIVAQGISYLLSIITGLVVPKMLGVEEYGYWQLFVFYGGYVNFGMLGAHDGMYLRLGGKEYSDLDYVSEGKQFKLLMRFESLLGAAIIIFALFAVKDANRLFVFVALAFYVVLTNASQYLGEMFQSVNETPIYSKATMINKISYMAIVISLLLLGVYSYQPYIIGMNICAFASVVYYVFHCKEFFCKHHVAIRQTIKSLAFDIKSGWKIMIGGYAAQLIIGTGRAIVDYKWGISTFGKLSVAISLVNMVMQFINQVSIVLFPALRTVSLDTQRNLYKLIRKCLFIILPLAYFAYFPLTAFIEAWLPEYSDTAVYLGILLPICIFDAKTNMLSLTYLKVLRKENSILAINVSSLLLNVCLIFIGLEFYDNLYVVLLSMVISATFRSVIFDFYMMRLFDTKTFFEDVVEVIFLAIFVVGNLLNSSFVLLAILLIYALVILIRRNDLKQLISMIVHKIKK